MRHEVEGVIEHDGERYSYNALIFTGDEHRADEIAAIEPQDSDLDEFVANEELWDKIADTCIADANERIHHDIRNDETLEEGMARLAEAYHPEELVKIWITENDFTRNNTGGGCTCLEKPINSEFSVCITAEAEAPTSVKEPVEVGIYDVGGEPIASTEVVKGLQSIDSKWIEAFVESHPLERADEIKSQLDILTDLYNAWEPADLYEPMSATDLLWSFQAYADGKEGGIEPKDVGHALWLEHYCALWAYAEGKEIC